MKKFLLLIACGFAFYACVPTQSTQTVQQPPIVNLVDSFVASHPDFMNNAITREKANDEWKKVALDSLKKNPNFLDGVNLTMIGINKTKKHGYIAQFRSIHNSERYKNINDLDFDVLTYVSDSIALTLVEKADYIIYGDIIGPINFPTMQKLYEAPLNRLTDKYSISKCEYRNGKYDIKLANIMMDIKEFKRK